MKLVETLIAKPPPLRTVEGGGIRVGSTRVSLDTVIGAYKGGSAAEEIVQQFPTLDIEDVHSVLAYYRWNRDAVEEYLADSRRRAEKTRARTESLPSTRALGERLRERLRRD